MKLKNLRFFTAVVECGGVNKASERLHTSQPAVSAGIKALEDELGGALFDRGTSRKLSLTPAGCRFYRQAQKILSQCDAAKSDFAGVSHGNRVRIGVLETLPQSLLIDLQDRLHHRQPTWQIELWEGSVKRLINWLGQGRLELALTHVNGDAEGQRELWCEPLVTVVAPDHRFVSASRNGIDLNDLEDEPFLHRSRCELDALGRARLRAVGISLRVVARGERDEWIFEQIRRGRGITLAPLSLVPPDLIAVAVNGLAINRCIGLQWPQGTDADRVEILSEELAGIRV